MAKERNFRHFTKRYVKKSLIYASSVHVGTYSKETHDCRKKDMVSPDYNYKLQIGVWSVVRGDDGEIELL